jgi:hypothetical protein
MLILTSGRTRQFMKLFSITFCKIRKSFPSFFDPQLLRNESSCVINCSIIFPGRRLRALFTKSCNEMRPPYWLVQ